MTNIPEEGLLPDLTDEEQARLQDGDPELREAEDSEESDEGRI